MDLVSYCIIDLDLDNLTLVCEELRKVETWDVLDVIKEVPAGLEDLYDLMMKQI